MVARPVAPGVVLVTYLATDADAGDSLRSSLWVHGADGWRVLYHQATAIPAPDPEA